jgi:hypothetical protein
MSKLYANQVTVRVWRNLKTWGYVPTAHFGHAAVTLSGMFLNVMPGDPLDRRRLHISFWPGEGGASLTTAHQKTTAQTSDFHSADKYNEMSRQTETRLEIGYRRKNGIPLTKKQKRQLQDGKLEPILEPRPGQVRREAETGEVAWLQSPEAKIALPGFNNKGHHWGLSIGRMRDWWQLFSQSNPHYKALSHQNCAGVALMALREGGGEAFEDMPTVRIYAEPLQVERYAQALQIQMERMEAWTLALDTDIRQALASGLVKPAMLTGLQDGLWSLQHSALGTFQMRSATIREIDEALQQYHSNTWKEGFQKKYRALARTFLGVVKHRHAKAESARSAAVLALGLQILALLRNPGPHM